MTTSKIIATAIASSLSVTWATTGPPTAAHPSTPRAAGTANVVAAADKMRQRPSATSTAVSQAFSTSTLPSFGDDSVGPASPADLIGAPR